MSRRWHGSVCGIGLLFAPLLAAAAGAAAEWPQWLGPDRNAVVPGGPKLLDQWPTNGPTLVWRSAPLAAAGGAGFGSAVVSGGRVFLYVNSKPATNNGVEPEFLAGWGWMGGVSDDLAKKIEEARTSDARQKIRGGPLWGWGNGDLLPHLYGSPELEAYIREFLATLEPAVAEKFGDHIRLRLRIGPGCFNWETMCNLAAKRGKALQSNEDFRALFKDIHGHSPLNGTINAESMKLFSCQDVIVCLDAASGRELWRREFPGQTDGSYGASGTPAVSDGKVYATGSAGLYCLAAADGALVWMRKCDYNHSSPLVANGALFYMNGVVLSAHDAATGRLLWRQHQANQTAGWWGNGRSVALWSKDGRNYLIGSGGAGLFCVDPAQGRMLWTLRDKAAGIVRSTPIIAGDLAAVCMDGGVQLFKLAPDKAEFLWEAKGGDRGGSALIYRDCVYIGGNHLPGIQCMDLKTGAIRWHVQSAGSEGVTPIAADGKIIFNTGNGPTILFRASPEKYEPLDEFGAGRMTICTTPALANGRLYLREQSCVACYDLTAPAK